MTARGKVTNRCIQSENLAVSPWSRTNCTAPSYGGPYPAGVAAMQTLTDDATPGLHYAAQLMSASPASLVVGREYVASVFAKKVAGSGVLGVQLGAGIMYFNVGTGVLGTTNSVTFSPYILDVGGGFYRCSIRTVLTSVNPVLDVLLCSADGTASYTGPSQQVIVGGAMIEETVPGQFGPGPYVLTGAATADGPWEPRQNLAVWSEDPSNALYTKTGCSTNASGDIVEDNSAGRHRFYQTVTVLANTPLVYSCRVTAGTRRYAYFTVNDAAGTMAWFDTQTGLAAGVQSGVTAWMVQRSATTFDCYASMAGIASGAINFSFGADTATGGNGNYAGTTSQVALSISRIQVAHADQPADYVRTTGAPANSSGSPRSRT